jgi:hypothetical protein
VHDLGAVTAAGGLAGHDLGPVGVAATRLVAPHHLRAVGGIGRRGSGVTDGPHHLRRVLGVLLPAEGGREGVATLHTGLALLLALLAWLLLTWLLLARLLLRRQLLLRLATGRRVAGRLLGLGRGLAGGLGEQVVPTLPVLVGGYPAACQGVVQLLQLVLPGHVRTLPTWCSRVRVSLCLIQQTQEAGSGDRRRAWTGTSLCRDQAGHPPVPLLGSSRYRTCPPLTSTTGSTVPLAATASRPVS